MIGRASERSSAASTAGRGDRGHGEEADGTRGDDSGLVDQPPRSVESHGGTSGRPRGGRERRVCSQAPAREGMGGSEREGGRLRRVRRGPFGAGRGGGEGGWEPAEVDKARSPKASSELRASELQGLQPPNRSVSAGNISTKREPCGRPDRAGTAASARDTSRELYPDSGGCCNSCCARR